MAAGETSDAACRSRLPGSEELALWRGATSLDDAGGRSYASSGHDACAGQRGGVNIRGEPQLLHDLAGDHFLLDRRVGSHPLGPRRPDRLGHRGRIDRSLEQLLNGRSSGPGAREGSPRWPSASYRNLPETESH